MLSPVKTDGFSVVDTRDELEIIAFEKAFYLAFCDIKQQKLIRQIWEWDDRERRIRPRAAYADLLIYKWTGANDLPYAYVAGIMSGEVSQYEQYGFTKPAEAGKSIEIATLFLDRSVKADIHKDFIKPFCHPYTRSLGYERLLATCAPRLLPLYLRWGWQLIAQNDIQGETRYFLLYDLKNQYEYAD